MKDRLPKRKKMLALLVGACLCALLSPLGVSLPVQAQGMYELKVGAVERLPHAPAQAVWTSSDTEVVQVRQDGSVRAVGVGAATVTARADGKKKRTYSVGVELRGDEPRYRSTSALRAAMSKSIAKNKKRIHGTVVLSLPRGQRSALADAKEIDSALRRFFPKSDDFFVAYSDAYTLRYAIQRTSSQQVEVQCSITFAYNPASAVAATYRGQSPTRNPKEEQLYQRCERIIEELGLRQMQRRDQKALAVHDYLVLHCAFDWEATASEEDWQQSADSYSAYGALVLGQATCKGYAQAMKLLLEAVDVPCDYLVGQKTVRHGWNRVQLDDGNWYHIDAASDDPVPDKPGRLRHDYFCLTDTEIQKTHSWQ